MWVIQSCVGRLLWKRAPAGSIPGSRGSEAMRWKRTACGKSSSWPAPLAAISGLTLSAWPHNQDSTRWERRFNSRVRADAGLAVQSFATA